MKKLLVLFVVASLCALANGQMILQISAGGNPEPEDSTIVLMPSDTIALDIWSPNGWQNMGDNGYFGLVCNAACATITGGVAHPAPGGPAPDTTAMLLDDLSEFFGNPGVYGQIFMAALPGGPGIFVDEIVLHCESANGPTQLQLITTDFETYFIVQDTLIIHQIPEPATIALLSLGGLLLRKRK